MRASQAPCSQCPGVTVPKDAVDPLEEEFEISRMQLHWEYSWDELEGAAKQPAWQGEK